MIYSKTKANDWQRLIILKRKELYKYPRNILIPVVFLIIGMLVVLIVYNLNVVKNAKPPVISTPVQMPLNTKAKFLVEASVNLGGKKQTKADINFSGDSNLNIDLANGKIIVENLNLKAKNVSVKGKNYELKDISVNLNPSYPSTGELNLKNGAVDISSDMIINFLFKKKGESFIATKINMTIPFKGNLDQKTGVIKLIGESTIPPGKFSEPLPIRTKVIATTKSDSSKKVSKK